MTYKLAPGVLAAVLVGLPAAAHADPVTIVNSYSGISVLAYASEGGASERRSFPHTFADIISRELTAHVGGTSATASASLASSQADPAHMWGNGAATAQYQTTNGTAGVSATAVFAVRFQLAAPTRTSSMGTSPPAGLTAATHSSPTARSG